jgi:hypothetical protein
VVRTDVERADVVRSNLEWRRVVRR